MKILITGANGQLGSELARFHQEVDLLLTDTPELDLTDENLCELYLQQNQVDCIINCAAYTAVDQAEDEPDLAHLINAKAAENLAKAAQKYGMRLLHISTDFVFDGQKNTPYLEEDNPNPINVYGQSKLAGEKAVLALGGVIVRTSWLYSEFAKNFVKTILRLAKEKETISVVADQIGSPTNARDLANTLIKMAQVTPKNSTYHYCNDGVASWFDFATAIVEFSGLSCQVEPITSTEFKTKAERPKFSVLSNTATKDGFSLPTIHWQKSLGQVIENLKAEKHL